MRLTSKHWQDLAIQLLGRRSSVLLLESNNSFNQLADRRFVFQTARKAWNAAFLDGCIDVVVLH